MSDDRCNITRMRALHFAHDIEHAFFDRRERVARARVKCVRNRARREAVRVEIIFFDSELCVAPFEIAGAVTADAMPEDQILCGRRRANRIRLNEAESSEGACERRLRKKSMCDRERAELGDLQRRTTVNARLTEFRARRSGRPGWLTPS